MGDKEIVIEEELAHDGLIDFPAFYSFCHSWFKDQEYNVVEEEYNEKISGNTREIGFKWKAGKKMGDYFKAEHALKFEIRNLSDVEVEIDGKKKKMNKGGIKIKMKGVLISDTENMWSGEGWFKKFAREVYDKYIIKKRKDDMEDKV